MVSELQLHGHHPGFGGAGRLYLGADEGHPHAARVREEVEDLGGRTGQGMSLRGGQWGGNQKHPWTKMTAVTCGSWRNAFHESER